MGGSPTHILFLNRSFWPDQEATGQFLTDLCDDLAARHQITFIAGPGAIEPARANRRRIGLWYRERRGSISIVRTWGTRLPKRQIAMRMLNLGTYFALAAAACGTMRRPDVIVAATDPPLLGLLGALLKRRWNCRLVYNVRDLYPDIARVNGGLRNRASLRLLDYANQQAFAAADRIIVVGHDMRERLLAKGLSPALVTVIPDWADCAAIKPLRHNRLRAAFGGRFVVMYSGNLGMSQQLESVLAAADRLRDNQRVLFVLAGEGARKASLMREAAARELPNVSFLSYQPRERLAESLGAADLHLIPLRAGAAGCLVPSKVYGVMAAARPFIAMMEPTAEVARLAIRHHLGKVVPPGDDAMLAAVVMELMQNPDQIALMGLNGRRVALRHFERKIITQRFEQLLTDLGPKCETTGASYSSEMIRVPESA